MRLRFPWRKADPRPPPPLMHITHGKAGSTWIDSILRGIYTGRVAPRMWDLPERFAFDQHPVYSAVFITRERYLAYPELAEIKRFVVIRDLRDTLISQYFSMRDTHELDPAGIVQKRRDILRSRTFEEGLQWLLENALIKQAQIQESWTGSGEIVLKYEELIADDLEMFRELFLQQFNLGIPKRQLDKAVVDNRFEKVFRRKLGEEDATSHGRKGAPGDWQNHFTRDFAHRFEQTYGALLVATGYEMDNSWVERVG